MENISDLIVVCSWVWSMLFLAAGIFLVIAWGEYLWKKGRPARIAKGQKRLSYLKELTEMEHRVGYRRA